jgi:hypothetical protein
LIECFDTYVYDLDSEPLSRVTEDASSLEATTELTRAASSHGTPLSTGRGMTQRLGQLNQSGWIKLAGIVGALR